MIKAAKKVYPHTNQIHNKFSTESSAQFGVRVYVAMSGGVDSSVAAALLKKRGFDIVGVFFKPWSPRQNFWTSGINKLKSKNLGEQAADCLWETDRQDAMRVCTKLGIPFKTWDFSKEYEKEVVKYMIDSYRSGITPNPDVMCNKEIKFGLFLKKALAEGADYIATGHYVRLTHELKSQSLNLKTKKSKIKNRKSKKLLTTHYSLLTGLDSNKDQSYFLWTLTQKQLKYCLFPIGDYTKPEVRKFAKKFCLGNHDKKDSQGVCFIGQLDMKAFLKNYIKPKPGNIVLADTNEIISQHDGTYYYTIGQRHGLDIKNGGGPYYVARKDINKNIVYVVSARQISHLRQGFGGQAKIEKVNWVVEKPKFPLNCQVKIRYRSELLPATITVNGKNAIIKFKKPARAVTSGQSAVIYRDQVVLGGGIII